MKPLSVRVRLTLAYTVTFGILLGVLALSIYRTAADRVYAQADAQLTERASAVRPFFNVSQSQVTWLADKERIDQTSYIVAYAIFDDKGEQLDSSTLARIYNFYFTDAARGAIERRSPTWETLAFQEIHRIRTMNFPLTGSDGRPYLLRVGMLLDQAETDLRQLAAILGTLVPLVLLMGGVAGWWLSGDALDPVVKITASTRQISASNLAQRLPLRGTNDELDRLSATLNEMIGRLQQSFDQMSQFLSNVSHELRTPLAALRGNCEIAIRTAKSEEECRAVLESNIEELDRMARTISDLLALARAEAGQTILKRRPENVTELARDAVESVRVLGAERGITLHFQGDGEVTAPVDPEHLLRVMLNLLDNAIKYNRPEGRVDVAVEADADWVMVSVRDTGPGISAEDQALIFERFYRGQMEGTGAIAGTGLGLGLARWVAAAHGGRIEVESQPGQGTCFRLRVPRRENGTESTDDALDRNTLDSSRQESWGPTEAETERRTPMHRNIVRWTYWLGILCAVVAFVWRAAVGLGASPHVSLPMGGGIGYEGFINGAVLFLLVAGATAGYLWVEEKKA